MRSMAIMAAAICLVMGVLHARPSGAADTRMCSTGNTEPVTDCFDWVTGPGSSENASIPMMYLNEEDGLAEDGQLWSTDMGIPVSDPAETKLLMMVYGDTFVENKDLDLYQNKYDTCMSFPPAETCATVCGMNDPFCMTYFTLFSREAVCEYLCAGLKADNAFYPQSNTTFFAAQADPLKNFGITFGDHMGFKHIVNTAKMEDAPPCVHGSNCWTGVYGYEYFYACPGDLVECEDGDKLLYIVTATVVWLQIVPGTPLRKTLHAMGKDGTGFYKFGMLGDIYKKTNGCRLTFDTYTDDPSYYAPGYYPHCPGGPGYSVQPVHPHHVPYSTPSLVLWVTDNPNVLWGWGTRFAMVTPLRGFKDPYGGEPGYLYFLGSGELAWDNTPTDLLYMTRVPASEDAIAMGEFEYFRGYDGDKTSWGSYNEATPIFGIGDFGRTRVSSAILRDGTWYVSVTLGVDGEVWKSYGMAVLTSTDGFTWNLADVVEYSNIFGATTASTINVYGHYWVPSAVLYKADAIPYVFSVWKAIRGYYDDFFFEGDPTYPIEAKRFRNYNTKMYWYYF